MARSPTDAPQETTQGSDAAFALSETPGRGFFYMELNMTLLDALREAAECAAETGSSLGVSWDARAVIATASDTQLAKIGMAEHRYGADIADAAREALWAR